MRKIQGYAPSPVGACGAAIVMLVLAAYSPALWAQESGPVFIKANQISEETRRQVDGPTRWILLADKAEKERKRQAQAKEAKEVKAARERQAVAQAKRSAPQVTSSPAKASVPAAPVTSAAAASAGAKVALAEPALALAAALPTDAPIPVPETEEASERAIQQAEAEPELEPELIDLVEPFISAAVKSRMHGEGNIVVRFKILANGTVRNAEIVEASHPALRQPTLKAIEQWRYAAPGKEVEKVVQLQIAPE